MAAATSPSSSPASLRTLIRQLGTDSLDVHRVVFVEPGLLPTTIDAEAEALCRDRNAARSALHDLLPGDDPPAEHLFYHRLERFSILLIHCPFRAELMGIFLSESYRCWSTVGEQLLRGLNADDHDAFFKLLPGLPTFLAENELPAGFASAWFVEIADRAGNDMASDIFWDGLKIFARLSPERALEVAALLCRQRNPGENALTVAASLLGVCRGISTTGGAASLLGRP